MEKKLIDDCFYVEQKRWGTWDSFTPEGKCIVTSLTEESCIQATRFILQGRQEGFVETKTYSTKDNYKL